MPISFNAGKPAAGPGITGTRKLKKGICAGGIISSVYIYGVARSEVAF
jgi:hypothetical protein